MIESPISLHEIRDNVNKRQYSTVDQYLADFELMYKNAETYNEPASIVAQHANQIFQFVKDQIHESESTQTRGNDVAEDMMSPEKLKALQLKIISDLVEYKQKGRKLSPIFMDEPNKDIYPEYYQVIERATSFNTAKKQIDGNEASTIQEFVDIVDLIFKNAKIFNEEGSQVYEDADTLQKVFNEKVDELKARLDGTQQGQGSLKLKVKPPQQQKLKLSLKSQGHDGPASTVTDDKHANRSGDKKSEKKPKAQNIKEELSLQRGKRNKAGVIGVSEVDVPERRNEGDEEEEQEDEEEDAEKPEEENQDDGEVDGSDGSEDNRHDSESDHDEDESFPQVKIPANVVTRTSKTANPLFQMVNITSNIPVTSRYMQAKNPVPPANFLDVFQLIVPPSKTHTIRAYSLTLATFHSSLNFSVDLDEDLHFRHYNLSLLHQGRRIAPSSSTASNPFSDTSKPLKDRFELTLTPGLNHIELSLQASPKRDSSGPPVRHSVHTPDLLHAEGSELEKLTFWITLSR
ncbi:Rsc4p [Sugiyamaella lignohabitans]|uniref:Rsc4p n=1 Tax=Sugiyamaella lignohabitans TaxID=796027 RepID=A0A167E079_9ASCO|nr:Rsc4p [Sugiyamaella lignohabitans]ANB13494.1 Rsc4p [Sugiyamaella lignohabitans]